MIFQQSIAIPTDNLGRVQCWVWYRLSRLIAVYNVWPLPGIVNVAKDDFKASSHISNDFCWFLMKFVSRDLGRLCSTRTSPFVLYAETAGFAEKTGYILSRVAENKSPEPAHVAVATYAFTVAQWFANRLPPENEWPDQLVEWAEVLGEMFASPMPTNPWEMTWLDCAATNANDLRLFLIATGMSVSAPVQADSFSKIEEVDPNDEPPDIYGYMAGVIVKGQNINPPCIIESGDVDQCGSQDSYKQWMVRLCSVVDDF